MKKKKIGPREQLCCICLPFRTGIKRREENGAVFVFQSRGLIWARSRMLRSVMLINLSGATFPQNRFSASLPSRQLPAAGALWDQNSPHYPSLSSLSLLLKHCCTAVGVLCQLLHLAAVRTAPRTLSVTLTHTTPSALPPLTAERCPCLYGLPSPVRVRPGPASLHMEAISPPSAL